MEVNNLMYGAAEVNAQYNRTPTSGAEANRKANEAADEASDKLQGYADDIQVRFWVGVAAPCCLHSDAAVYDAPRCSKLTAASLTEDFLSIHRTKLPSAMWRTHDLQEWWENNDEKPTTVALGVAGFVALWATSGLLDAVNKLPLIGGVFEVCSAAHRLSTVCTVQRRF
jgi:CAAD domains of cyanobacterial aminoacyl-tRNA synthetase